tara:strand:+ start:2062 stop:2502 length:441 start_codon:yes stop_codon:yes gene_type:complete
MRFSYDELTTREQAVAELALHAVAVAFGEEPRDILSTQRQEHIAVARQAAYWLMRKSIEMPYSHIGCVFDGQEGKGIDHGAVVHGVKRMNDILVIDWRTGSKNARTRAKVEKAIRIFKEMKQARTAEDEKRLRQSAQVEAERLNAA